MENNKKVYLNIMRIIAAILVLLNHVDIYWLYRIEVNLTEVQRFTSCTLVPVITIGVPLFLTISGALLLKKDEGIKEILKKRVLKYSLCLLIFSVIGYIIKYGKSFNILEFITLLLSSKIFPIYWFIYTYIGMLLVLPLLKKIVLGIDKSNIKYYLILVFLYKTVGEAIGYFYSVKFGMEGLTLAYFRIPILTDDFVFYPILGYYLDNVLQIDNIKKKHIIIMLIVTVTCNFIITTVLYLHSILMFRMEPEIQKAFNYLYVIVIFIVIKKLYVAINRKKEKKIINNILFDIGKSTVGVYFLTPFVQMIPIYNQMLYYLHIHNYYILGSFAAIAFTFAIASVITIIYQKLKKYLNVKLIK